MQRFEIRRFLPDFPEGQNPYVVILQAKDIDAMASIVVAPLERRERATKLSQYELPIDIETRSYVIVLHELASQPKSELGAIAGSAQHLEWEIGRALDRLLFGV
ncbi:MAG: CcdB family protein [Alphaproteobacteria bacterium]